MERAAGTRILWARGRTNGCTRHAAGVYPQIRTGDHVREPCAGACQWLSAVKHELACVQFRCNKGRPVLRDDQLRNGMRRKDKAILREAYPQHQHRLEAEARTVSQLPTHFGRGGAYSWYRT